MADNPFSWAILCVLGFYFMYRFFSAVIAEKERISKEIEKEREIFLENPIDKRNAMCYNKYNKNERK